MKIDDMIKKLQSHKDEVGNIDVMISIDCEENEDFDIREYNVDDNFCVGIDRTTKNKCLIIQGI